MKIKIKRQKHNISKGQASKEFHRRCIRLLFEYVLKHELLLRSEFTATELIAYYHEILPEHIEEQYIEEQYEADFDVEFMRQLRSLREIELISRFDRKKGDCIEIYIIQVNADPVNVQEWEEFLIQI